MTLKNLPKKDSRFAMTMVLWRKSLLPCTIGNKQKSRPKKKHLLILKTALRPLQRGQPQKGSSINLKSLPTSFHEFSFLFSRLFGNRPALDCIKTSLVKLELRSIEEFAVKLIKKFLQDINHGSAVSYVQAYELMICEVDCKFLLQMSSEASFVKDFLRALETLDLCENDDSSSEEDDESSDPDE